MFRFLKFRSYERKINLHKTKDLNEKTFKLLLLFIFLIKGKKGFYAIFIIMLDDCTLLKLETN